MRAAFRTGLVLLSAAVLVVGLLPHVRPVGVAVDVLLLFAVVAGLTGGPERGAIVGFAAGLTLDLLVMSGPVGMAGVAYCIVGFVAGRYQLSVVRSSRMRLMVTTGLASALGYALLVALGWVMGQRNMVSDRLWIIVAVIAGANALLAPLAARIEHWAWDDSRHPAYPVMR